MDTDASQYAVVSRGMLKSGDFLHLYEHGNEYLDKPPFLFWVSSLSMSVLGANNLGYKLPSILFALWAIFATYKLGRRLYDDVTARMAALVLATCQGMFLMTNDIRCDTILMAWVITAIWLINEWVFSRKLKYLFGGCVAIGFGMMTKGPIALMVPVFCFMSDWILKRQWKNFRQPAFIVGLLIIAVMLIPMSIGLYQQFDMHPEKVFNGKTGTSGLRFYYWSQSFGRLTGDNPWKNGADISFLIVNMLWSFLPWMFFFLPALFINIAQLIRQKFRLQPHQEWITNGGFLLAYFILGSSSYQLPHYIFVVFPLAAIITAKFFKDIIEEQKYPRFARIMGPAQIVISVLLLLATLGLIAYVFPAHYLVIAGWAVGVIIWLYLARKKMAGKYFWLSAATMIIINVFLTNQFYYSLLKYQVGSQVGKYIVSKGIPAEDVGIYRLQDPLNSIYFYGQGTVKGVDTTQRIQNKYVLTMAEGKNALVGQGYHFQVEKQGDFFKVSELTLPFLNPNTRSTELKQYYLLRME
jgi:4-amino-4-deoxy-L-arabinose transferase-like glycosyltransferase